MKTLLFSNYFFGSTFGCICFSLMSTMLLLLPSWSLVNADVVCPPGTTYNPFCNCIEYSLKRGTIDLYCYGFLVDSQVSDILDAFLTTSGVSPVGSLSLGVNRLTRVPTQIQLFTQLVDVFLGNNFITSIGSGTFNFPNSSDPIQLLELQNNQLMTIAPGAFRGDGYGKGSSLWLFNNNLTRFESTVFYSVLEKMAPFGGYPNASILLNSMATFDCSNCHLAWLIRDNRHFIPSIFGGQCSNGTTFEELIPSGFVDCPSFVCPLGYDGYYADPSTCSSYYICRTNVAYHYDCPADLVFDPETNQCDLISNVPSCEPNKEFVCPSADGYFGNPLSCSSYYLCIDNDPILVDCPTGFVFNPDKSQCDKPENVPNCN